MQTNYEELEFRETPPGDLMLRRRCVLQEVAQHLRPGSVFALWSDGDPDDAFLKRLEQLFRNAQAQAIASESPLTRGTSRAFVYVGRSSGSDKQDTRRVRSMLRRTNEGEAGVR